MGAMPVQTSGSISFGPFTLNMGQRLLLKEGKPVELGARTLDTLIALVSRPNEAMSKKDLMARVWPDVVVEEGNLRFHIAVLRKALGDGQNGARYIATLAGRGYCFVAPLYDPSDMGNRQAPAAVNLPRSHALPPRLLRMVGREDGLLTISSLLEAKRFVTIVGAGGVGKTTVAVATANDISADFEGAVLFLDLSALSDPTLVATSLASILGLSVQADDPTPNVVAFLRDKAVLLVFDNCEHLVEAAAALTAGIYAAAPRVHILATSREALRVEGEHVYKLDPLSCPPDEPDLKASTALTFPAIQLFMERAAASGAGLKLNDSDAPIVTAICRKLDGIALAIELAAGRVGTYGLQQTAALLEARLSLLWQGQRGAPARHQTLRAALDWSYGLLSELERLALQRLAVFAGDFTLEAALAVAATRTRDRNLVLSAIDSLVSKSMVTAGRAGEALRYRVLETTRAYTLEVSEEDEFAQAAARHATFYRQWLEDADATWRTLPDAEKRIAQLADIANVRAALKWSFGECGDKGLGIRLAAAAAPVFVAMSLFIECRHWSEKAIQALGDSTRGSREEMQLQASLGISMMFLKGQGEAASIALNRSLAIANFRGDAVTQLQVMAPLVMFHLRIGDFRTALAYGQRGAALAKEIADPGPQALGHSLVGISLTHTGNLNAARAELEAAEHVPGYQRESATYLGFDGHDLAGVFLARTLWLQGYPDKAVKHTFESVNHAAAVNHPVTLSITLVWAVSVFLWVGDLETAERYIDWFITRAETHSLGPYLAVGRGYKGQLAVRRGDAQGGIESLESALTDLHAVRYELLTTAFSISLIEGLAALGRFDKAIKLTDEAVKLVEANGDASYMPELLRLKGNVLFAAKSSGEDALACLTQSLELSRQQGALAWELRTAIDVARYWSANGQAEQAQRTLRPVFERFVEGSETADLKAAAYLLERLR